MGTVTIDKPARVRMTPRDAMALEWLSQMYGAPLDVVARLLDATQQRTYALVKRWTNAGWAASGRVDAGPMWVWPNRQTAAAYLGWDPGAWLPRPSQAAHLRACAIARLALAGTDATTWMPERKLRHESPKKERGKTEPYLPDGVWQSTTDGQWRPVEVELTSKGTTRTNAVVRNALTSASERGAAGVLYVCGTEAIRASVIAAAAAAEAQFARRSGAKLETVMLAELAQRVELAPTTGLS